MTSLSEIKPLAIRLIKSEGAFLAAIPFAGSLIALEFEKGYLFFFDVPINIIQLDFIRIATVSGIITFFFFIFLLLLDIIVLIVNGPHPIRRALLRPLVFGLILGVALYISPAPSIKWWSLVIIVIVAGAVDLIPPLFKRAEGETYLERLSNELSMDEKNTEAQSTKVYKLTYGRQLISFVAITVFGMMMVFSIGQNEAKNQSSYWVMANDQSKLLIRNYGELLVFKSFDPTSKQIGEELFLLKFSDSSPIILKKVHTGELAAAKQTVR